MKRTSRNLTVGLMVAVGLAAIGWQDTAQADAEGSIGLEDNERLRRCWTGIRSSSTR